MASTPNLLRDRQDEAIGVCKRLLAGERFTYHSDWFELNDAALQILPLQEDDADGDRLELSPSGMTLAGKYGIGVLSIASTSTEGLTGVADPVVVRRAGGEEARTDG